VAHLTAVEHGLNNHVLHCGYLCSPVGTEIRRWTTEMLRPAVVYLHEDNVVDSFFGGLLFDADRSTTGKTLSARALGLGEPATSVDWLQALDELFLPDANLPASLQLSKQRPFQKSLDIWVGLPYPQESTLSFAVLPDHPLSFKEREDRIFALKWWVDQCVSRWHELSLSVPGHTCQLRGFVWTKSSLLDEDEAVATAVAAHIHATGLKLKWIQNYVSGKALTGYTMGFDLICLRPTYTGIEPRGALWIQYASSLAQSYHFGMSVWGEDRLYPYQVLDFLNAGRDSFMQAYQTHELPYGRVHEWYTHKDPMYVYVYAYTKGAYATIAR